MIGSGGTGPLLSPADGGVSVTAVPEREGILEFSDDPLSLHFGGRLNKVRIAWRLVGAGPLVAALGGISAGRLVTDPRGQGWWNEVAGPHRALDTRTCQILGFDYLGGSGDTTGPKPGQQDFPAISAYDQALMLKSLVEHLDSGPLQAIVGASYGGMVALAFAEHYPELVRHIVVISAADRSHPLSTAWRSVQRAMVRYALKHGDGAEGLRLARALAMTTYRSAEEFEARFGGEPKMLDGRFRFPVEGYLLARGDAYAASYVPEAFVCLSESIDLHKVDAGRIRVPSTLVAVREDQLVPLEDMRLLRDRLAGPVELVELSSLYGHDAFLKECEALRPIVAKAVAT